MKEITIGTLVHADILAGEETDGEPAGLGAGHRLRGVGLTRLALVYAPDELTEFVRPEDTCWAAEVLSTPLLAEVA